MKDFNELYAALNSVRGWISKREAKTLFNLAKKIKRNGIIVEIGSYEGKSSIIMAMANKYCKIFTIDTHKGSVEHRLSNNISSYSTLKSNIKKFNLEKNIFPIKGESINIAKLFKKNIDMLFIDASHELKDVKNDFEYWEKLLNKNGIIAMHDTIDWQGPKFIAKKYLFYNKNFSNIGFSHSLTYAIKKKRNSIEHIKIVCTFILKEIYECVYKLKKGFRNIK